MTGILGIAVVFLMVFGGYLAAGGNIGIILTSLPFELAIIGGAACGAFLLSSDGPAIRQTLRALPSAFQGTRWRVQDYQDLLCLLSN